MLVERCFDGDVDRVAAHPPARPFHWAAAIAHEWAALVDASLRRGC